MSAFWQSVLEVSIGVVAGGVIGGVINWLFARRSSRELRREARELRRHTALILRAIQNAQETEKIRIDFDEHGEPIGLLIDLSGVSTGRSGASGNLTQRTDQPRTSEQRPWWRRMFGS